MRDKSESCTHETSVQSRPFFARFLEGQDTAKELFQTLKYPSDLDEIERVMEYAPGNNSPQQ